MALHGNNGFVRVQRARAKAGAINHKMTVNVLELIHFLLHKFHARLQVVRQRSHHHGRVHKYAVVIRNHLARGAGSKIKNHFLGGLHHFAYIRLKARLFAIIKVRRNNHRALLEIWMRSFGNLRVKSVGIQANFLNHRLHLWIVVHGHGRKQSAGVVRS